MACNWNRNRDPSYIPLSQSVKPLWEGSLSSSTDSLIVPFMFEEDNRTTSLWSSKRVRRLDVPPNVKQLFSNWWTLRYFLRRTKYCKHDHYLRLYCRRVHWLSLHRPMSTSTYRFWSATIRRLVCTTSRRIHSASPSPFLPLVEEYVRSCIEFRTRSQCL